LVSRPAAVLVFPARGSRLVAVLRGVAVTRGCVGGAGRWSVREGTAFQGYALHAAYGVGWSAFTVNT
jgi:hypothetical protein